MGSERRRLDDAIRLLDSLTAEWDDIPELCSVVEQVKALRRLYDVAPQPFGTFVEERWETTVLGWRVAARCDHLTVADDGTLTDWKVTSVWSVKEGKPKPEWVAQVNVTRYLGTLTHGIRPQRLAATCILRDWRKNERRRYGDEYPPLQVATIPIPVWSDDECLAYLTERIALHQAAQAGGPLPPCTPEERWEKPTIFAVMKKGRQSAVRLYFSMAEAERHVDGIMKTDPAAGRGLSIAVRPGESPRCAEYCDMLPYCTQGQALTKGEFA
jgi:hypothetical protein